MKINFSICRLTLLIGLLSLNSGDIQASPEFVTDVSINNEAVFGGISGLDYDSQSGLFYAISDDRSERDKARFYRFSLDQHFLPTAIEKTFLRDPKGKYFAKGSIDPEAIRITNKGKLIWSSETAYQQNVLFVSSTDMKTTKAIKMPSFLLPATVNNKLGFAANKGIEGLTYSIDGKYLFVALEAPSINTQAHNEQDATSCVIAVFDATTHKLVTQFYYQPDPIVHQATAAPFLQDNGISEILMLTPTTMLVLERAGWHIGNKQFAFNNRLYQISIPSVLSHKGSSQQPLSKSLYFSFEQPTNEAQPNLEAMTLMNRKDGRYLILAADNNFNPSKDNRLIVLKLDQ